MTTDLYDIINVDFIMKKMESTTTPTNICDDMISNLEEGAGKHPKRNDCTVSESSAGLSYERILYTYNLRDRR